MHAEVARASSLLAFGILATTSLALAAVPTPERPFRTSLDGSTVETGPRPWRRSLGAPESFEARERSILASLEGERYTLVGSGGVTRPIRVSLESSRSTATFPIVNAPRPLAHGSVVSQFDAPPQRFIRLTLDGSSKPATRRWRLTLGEGAPSDVEHRAPRHLRTVLE